MPPLQKRKVLFISPQPFFEWRGSPIRVKANVTALGEQGYEVDLLTLPIGADAAIPNVRIIRAWDIFNSKSISIGPSLLKLWFDLILLVQGAKLVLKNNYDVLHGTEEAGFICYLLSLISKRKVIFEKHSDSNSYKNIKAILVPFLKLYRMAETITVRKSDKVICTGPGLTEQALEDMKCQETGSEKIHTIPDIPSSIKEASKQEALDIREQLNFAKDDIVISYAGSFASYQGIDILFDAIPLILKKHSNAQFIIIGGSEEEIAFNKAALKEQGVTDRATFLGKVDPDKLPAYLTASNVLLAPRKSGVNSPLKILDYFKAGAAIVATNTIANQRLLNKDNAILCEFDAAEFSKSITHLIESPKERKRLGKNGYQLYKDQYNFDVFKKQLAAVYDNALS